MFETPGGGPPRSGVVQAAGIQRMMAHDEGM